MRLATVPALFYVDEFDVLRCNCCGQGYTNEWRRAVANDFRELAMLACCDGMEIAADQLVP